MISREKSEEIKKYLSDANRINNEYCVRGIIDMRDIFGIYLNIIAQICVFNSEAKLEDVITHLTLHFEYLQRLKNKGEAELWKEE